eukprot:TRINITY_DN69812_c0_g1_i1.p1 TRINITY_DN69812_c0_g1~~TRINITY_DN69812_c0_g1_i1.p1  ORF type:complete len:169 (+),score=31.81 TRINITY_DN69812_c0_g1_i1:54-560(+)
MIPYPMPANLLQYMQMFDGCCSRCSGQEDVIPEKLKTEYAIKSGHGEELGSSGYDEVEEPGRSPSPNKLWTPMGNTGGLWYRVKVEKTKKQAKLGVALEVSKEESCNEIVITALDADGLLGLWNKANPTTPIRVGDIIFEVNENQGNYKKIFDLLKNEDVLYLKIRRP